MPLVRGSCGLNLINSGETCSLPSLKSREKLTKIYVSLQDDMLMIYPFQPFSNGTPGRAQKLFINPDETIISQTCRNFEQSGRASD